MSEFETVREVVCALCQCVSAVRAAEVLVFLCLRSSVSHMTGGTETVRFLGLELKVVTKNDGDFMDVIVPLLVQALYGDSMTYLTQLRL
jgi:hypothetical protein